MAAVITITNVTANPMPDAVLMSLDTAMNGHIPRKYVRAMLLVNNEANIIANKVKAHTFGFDMDRSTQI